MRHWPQWFIAARLGFACPQLHSCCLLQHVRMLLSTPLQLVCRVLHQVYCVLRQVCVHGVDGKLSRSHVTDFWRDPVREYSPVPAARHYADVRV